MRSDRFFESIGLAVLCLAAGLAVPSRGQDKGYAENHSYDTLCAEMDNIDIPIFCTNLSAYRIVARAPRYNPTSISEWGADWDDCSTTFDSHIWTLGVNDGSAAEFYAGTFAPDDIYYAPDDPAAGIDEEVSELPKEINNDWMYSQYIRFTADQSGDFNAEARFGSTFVLKLATIDNTTVSSNACLEIRLLTLTTNGWVNQGSRVFNQSNLWGTWDIPDLTWMYGTDTNLIHLEVVRAGDGGQSTSNSWAYYDYIEMNRRGSRGSNSANPPVLYDDGDTVVEAVFEDFWVQYPEEMRIEVLGGSSIETSQYVRIKRRLPGTTSWTEVFVMYQNAYARILPIAPANLGAMPYGASIILGPSTNEARPAAHIERVVVDPVDLSIDITYLDQTCAHVELRADQDGHVVDVSDITYDTISNAAFRFRSMWVTDGKSDIDRIENEEGVYPIMDNWSRLEGPWWSFFRQTPSYHNTYCPEFRVELMNTNASFLSREAETFEGGNGCTIMSDRTNAAGGQTLFMDTNGAEAVYTVTLAEDRPGVYMHLRYSDVDGGAVDITGNTVAVSIDGVTMAQTYSVNTGGSNDFEWLPTLYLGDCAAGDHEIRITTGEGTGGIELDRFELVSEPPRTWTRKSILTRQGESCNWYSNAVSAYRASAVGDMTMHLEHGGTIVPMLGFNVTIPTNYSHVYMRLRYSDDVGPNKISIYIDDVLRGKFPTEDTGYWTDFKDAYPLFLGALTAGDHQIRIQSTLETYGVDVDEFELYAYDNRPPDLNLAELYTLAVGSATTIVFNSTDTDGDALAITNTIAPPGASMSSNRFSWTAAVAYENTTNAIAFVVNDQSGMTNSESRYSADLVVPRDWDGDGLPDGWEWTSFSTLTNSPTGDADGDGADNQSEYVAGTQANDPDSAFAQDLAPESGAATNHWIAVSTEPGGTYTIYYTDEAISNGVTWIPFANPADGVGTWTETNIVPDTHVFVDDEGGQTTGGAPADGRRYYRVKVTRVIGN